MGGYRSVTDYGANGADEMDDTAAIKAADSVRISGVDTAGNPVGFAPAGLSLDAVK